MTFSLVATSIGGFFMLTLPVYPLLLTIHAFWGITSILTFWASLIKATRGWGHSNNQGTSFGLLDAGRGAVAAILASLATTVFAYADSTQEGLQRVLLVYSLAPLLAGLIIWWVVPENLYKGYKGYNNEDPSNRIQKAHWSRFKRAFQKPEVGFLTLIIFCSYILYLGTFDLPAFAEKGYDQTKTFGALLGTIRDWMRPIAALGAGLLADQIRLSKTIGGVFAVLILTFASLFFINPSLLGLGILWTQVILAGLAVFALRGVYFAMLEEIGIPYTLTGTTVGIVSFIGFTLDIFGHLLSGWFVDTYEGTMGYHYYFAFLACVAALGLLATWAIRVTSGSKSAIISQSVSR